MATKAKPTLTERAGKHFRRHGLTYVLAGTAIGAGLAGAVASYNTGSDPAGVFGTGFKAWAAPRGLPTGVQANPTLRTIGINTSPDAGEATGFRHGYSRGLTEGIMAGIVNNPPRPNTADAGTSAELYNPHRGGIRAHFRDRQDGRELAPSPNALRSINARLRSIPPMPHFP